MNAAARPEMSRALVEAARAGDEAALVAVLAATQPNIRRYARRTCIRATDVEDAVQEALLLIHRRLGSLRALSSFTAWAMAIVRRECLRLARRYGLPIESVDDTALDDNAILSKTDHELRLDLARAIHSLPDHYREVIIIRDLEEQTVEEIAAQLSLTREAVKGRLHRARSLVREYLKD